MRQLEALTQEGTLQDAAGADGDGIAFDIRGYAFVAVQVSGTFVADIEFEGSVDGQIFDSLQASDAADGEELQKADAEGLYFVQVAGLSDFRTPISGYVSGTVTVNIIASTVAPGEESEP